ncbi:MAG: hypothetical protein JRC66_08750 [Deltaproteobacteria bacterium]|nr:hypothetical protein [Deltaproteobacteria bacterium]
MNFPDLLKNMLADDAAKRKLWKDGKGPPGPGGFLKVIHEHFLQFTLYNPPALLAAIVFTGSLFFPWWYAKVYEDYYTINAYAFILQHDLPPEGVSFVIETPIVAVVFLILMLAGYFFLVFWGSTMEGEKGKLFLFWGGLFMLLYTVGFYGALLFATHRIGQPVTGYSSIPYTVEVDIFMTFSKAYFIAISAGAVCMVSALVHGRFSINLH